MPTNTRRAARERGIRFERSIVKKLRKVGFHAERTDETAGYGVGSDIAVFLYIPFLHSKRWVRLKVAIQCKSTNQPSDLQRGMREAKAGQPNEHFWACIHSNRGEIRYLLSSGKSDIECPDFKDLVAMILLAIPLKEDYVPEDLLRDTAKQLQHVGPPRACR